MPTATEVRTVLRGVVDPELDADIVDLGFIYRVEVGDDVIRVEMTLTTPSCHYASDLRSQVEGVLRAAFGGHRVQVDLVWEPRWTPEMMSDAARRQFGAK